MKASLTSGIRDPECGLCPMASSVSSPNDLCVIPSIAVRPEVLIVMKNQPRGRQLEQLTEWIERLAGDKKAWAVTGAVKCISWSKDAGKRDAVTCARAYLDREIQQLQPKLIVAMGNEALLAVTGRVGVTKYRGQSMSHTPSGIDVYPTISPGMVKRNPGLERGFLADLRNTLLVGSAEERSERLAVRTRAVMTGAGLKALREALRAAAGVAYDIESNSFDEYRPDSRMVSVSFTTWGVGATQPEENWAVPLYHPESPFKEKWRKVLHWLMSGVDWESKETSAHNGKFDCRWLNKHSGTKKPMPQTFDTMLALHMLDEAQPKGLKPAAQAYLGVEPWGIDTTDLLNTPLRQVLRYNGLDTWYTAWLTFELKKQLEERPRTLALYNQLLVAASGVFTEIEQRGIWVDRELLQERKQQAEETLHGLDAQLMSYIPEGVGGVNFNPSNFLRWFLFEHLELPILARGKAKEDGTPGNPSVAEAVLLHLKDEHPHPVIDLLLERSKWQKYTSAFFSAYAEQVDSNDRIHTTFKLSGTVTGRLSSGKGDAEKVTGRVQNRGVNLQQVPRDPFVRGIFGAPDGWVFVEADYSQVELRLAAYMAQEPTMLHLYATGQDIHTSMAQQMVGRLDVSSEERKKAKAVNFGFLYGMGANKFIETAWSNYGVKVSPEEARDFRATFFNQFPKLKDWHNRQRRLVSRFKRVESPIGRVRHLPDIDSADSDVKAEAQRQAINSPVQSFASDLCILSLIRLDRFFRAKGYRTRSVGTVHDAINFEVPLDEAPRVVPIIRYAMENLPLLELFGVDLNVPIQADVKVGTRWGAAKEVAGEVSCSPKLMKEWLKKEGF